MVDLALASPIAGPVAEAATKDPIAETPTPPAEPSDSKMQEPVEPPPDPPAVAPDLAVAEPPAETQVEVAAEPEIKVELPPPDDPPPVKVAELKAMTPPKATPPASKPQPRPQPSPSTPRPNALAATASAPTPRDGDASSTQQAAASSLVVFEGKPRYRVPPTPAVYPARSIELGQQGEVLIRVRLDPDGNAAEILVWRGSGFALLDNAALKAVRGWQFHPAMRDGRTVAAWIEIPVRFHLR